MNITAATVSVLPLQPIIYPQPPLKVRQLIDAEVIRGVPDYGDRYTGTCREGEVIGLKQVLGGRKDEMIIRG